MSVLLTKRNSHDTKLSMRKIISSFHHLYNYKPDISRSQSYKQRNYFLILNLSCLVILTNDLFRWQLDQFSKESTRHYLSEYTSSDIFISSTENHSFLLKLLFCCCEISFLHYLVNNRRILKGETTFRYINTRIHSE